MARDGRVSVCEEESLLATTRRQLNAPSFNNNIFPLFIHEVFSRLVRLHKAKSPAARKRSKRERADVIVVVVVVVVVGANVDDDDDKDSNADIATTCTHSRLAITMTMVRYGIIKWPVIKAFTLLVCLFLYATLTSCL